MTSYEQHYHQHEHDISPLTTNNQSYKHKFEYTDSDDENESHRSNSSRFSESVVDQYEVGSDDGDSDEELPREKPPVEFTLSNKSQKLLQSLRSKLHQENVNNNNKKTHEDDTYEETTQGKTIDLSETQVHHSLEVDEEEEEEQPDLSSPKSETKRSGRLAKMIHRFRTAPPMSKNRRERMSSKFQDTAESPKKKKKSWWQFEDEEIANENPMGQHQSTIELEHCLEDSLNLEDEKDWEREVELIKQRVSSKNSSQDSSDDIFKRAAKLITESKELLSQSQPLDHSVEFSGSKTFDRDEIDEHQIFESLSSVHRSITKSPSKPILDTTTSNIVVPNDVPMKHISFHEVEIQTSFEMALPQLPATPEIVQIETESRDVQTSFEPIRSNVHTTSQSVQYEDDQLLKSTEQLHPESDEVDEYVPRTQKKRIVLNERQKIVYKEKVRNDPICQLLQQKIDDCMSKISILES